MPTCKPTSNADQSTPFLLPPSAADASPKLGVFSDFLMASRAALDSWSEGGDGDDAGNTSSAPGRATVLLTSSSAGELRIVLNDGGCLGGFRNAVLLAALSMLLERLVCDGRAAGNDADSMGAKRRRRVTPARTPSTRP